MDKKRFKIAASVLCVEYDYVMPPAKMVLWMAKLGKYDISQIEAAVDVLIESRTSPFFPRLSEIIHAIAGDPESVAASRWNDVVLLARDGKALNDPVSAGVVKRMGGLSILKNMSERERPFLQKQFIQMYVSADISVKVARRAKSIGSQHLAGLLHNKKG